MKILGIEASGLVASAALWEDGVLKAEYTINNKLTHSQTLLPMIEGMLALSGEPLSEADAIAVSEGPGSFTGLRIGAATAKGLALAMNLPVIGVSSLRALAENEADAEAVVVPIMDARRGQVYCGAWYRGEEVLPERACDIAELLSALPEMLSERGLSEVPVLFLGDGVPVHEQAIKESEALSESQSFEEKGAQSTVPEEGKRKFRVTFAAASNQRQRAASVAQYGAALYTAWLSAAGVSAEEAKALGADALSERGLFFGAVMNSDEFVPRYLRKPQAEREKDAGLLEDAGKKSLKKLARGLREA